MNPNLPNIKRFIDLLANAATEHPNPVCDIESIRSTCGSPGCVVGWAWYLMPDVLDVKPYSFTRCVDMLESYFNIQSRSKEFLSDWAEANPDLYLCGFYDVFASSFAYGVGYQDSSNITLLTIVRRWTNYYNFLLSRVPSVLS